MASRKYNWEGLFERPTTELVRGVDYDVSQSTMAQTIRNNASQRGVRVRLTDTGDTITVEVLHRDPRSELPVSGGSTGAPGGLEGGALPQVTDG